jgi:hypothetical protein
VVEALGLLRVLPLGFRGGVQGTLPQFVERRRTRRRGSSGLFGLLRLDQVKDDRPSFVPVDVHPLAVLPARAGEPAQVAVALALAQRPEQVEVLAVRGVVPYGLVAPDEPHVPDPALPRVEEDAVVVPTVFVTVLLPGLPGEQEDEGPAPGRRDAPLLLAPVGSVYVRTTVIDFANLEHAQRPRRRLPWRSILPSVRHRSQKP